MFCRHCGKEVDENWKVCPSCGKALEDGEYKENNESVIDYNTVNTENCEKLKKEKKKKPIYKRWWFWVLIVIGMFIILFSLPIEDETDGEAVKEVVKVEDYSELAGIEEKTLADYGFEKSDDYDLGYGMLDGGVEVGCSDGKVDVIKILKEEEGISLCGIEIGMPEDEAYKKLSEVYPEDVSNEDEKVLVDFDTKEEVKYEAEDEKISIIQYRILSDEMVAEYQREKEEASRAEYIFPDSDSKYLSEDEVRKVEAEKLFIGRNEIFARHGYIFENENLQQYFGNTSWYEGTVSGDQFNADAVFNDFEKKNVELIKKIEDEINGPSEEEQAKQSAIDEAYNFLVGHSFHLQDSEPLMTFQSGDTIKYRWGGEIPEDYYSYSITARYEVYKDDQKEWLTFITIDGEEYYLRMFTDGTINISSNSGMLDGWYELYN